jgi:uncharacterized membrane protein YfcA
MEYLTTEIAIVLFVVAFIAGCVDAIAGGGGLLTIPALLLAGLPPALALGTNKLQGVFGTLTAVISFRRKGHIELKPMVWEIGLTFIGAAIGAIAVQNIQPGVLLKLIPFAMLGIALYFGLSPNIGSIESHQRISRRTFAATAGFGIGFYDGFLGPGAGSFYVLAYVSLLGMNIIRATAHTKVLNLTSNFGGLVFFVLGGNVIWALGLLMAVGQICGAYLGSQLAMKHGGKLIRPLIVVSTVAISAKLLFDAW